MRVLLQDAKKKVIVGSFNVVVTMTMTHSCEDTNVSQKPGPTDMSAGVMTSHKKNLISLYALLNKQGRLVVLCFETVYRVPCGEKNQQAHAVTNSNEFAKVTTSTHVCSKKKGWKTCDVAPDAQRIVGAISAVRIMGNTMLVCGIDGLASKFLPKLGDVLAASAVCKLSTHGNSPSSYNVDYSSFLQR